MTRAALYLRISMDRTGEHLGVDRQREDCEEQAKALGWDVVETYVDNDKSAYKERPDYKRMLVDVDAGQIDAIIAWHPDRLYRVVKDLGELVDVCKRNNTQIATVKAGTIDLTTPTGRLVAGLLAQVATYEGEAKADRWRRSWRQGREAGKWAKTGARLFGYTRDGDVIDAEAKIVRDMADRVIEGQPFLTITRWLHAEGIKTTQNGIWTVAGMKRHLENPVIAGWATLNGEIVAEGDWEPLLDRETWDTVRALTTANSRPYVPRKALLVGALFCGNCGYRMITSSQKRTRTYRCPNRPSMPGCGKVSGNAGPIEEIVEEAAKSALSNPKVRQRIAELRSSSGVNHQELSALQLRKAELEASLDDTDVPVQAILRAIERTKERIDELLDNLAARNMEPLPAGGEWPDDVRRRRALVDLVVQRVELVKADRSRGSRLGFDNERVKITPRDLN